jgi:hypothetical protein
MVERVWILENQMEEMGGRKWAQNPSKFRHCLGGNSADGDGISVELPPPSPPFADVPILHGAEFLGQLKNEKYNKIHSIFIFIYFYIFNNQEIYRHSSGKLPAFPGPEWCRQTVPKDVKWQRNLMRELWRRVSAEGGQPMPGTVTDRRQHLNENELERKKM